MSTTTTKEAEGLSYQELKDLLDKKKESEIEKLTKELTAAKGIVASLEAQLANLGVTTAPTTSPKKRGRPAKNAFKINGAAPKMKPTKRGKRGAVGEAITAYVTMQGKTGAKVADIAKSLGSKPANVTAFFYSKANRKKFKKIAPATFALK